MRYVTFHYDSINEKVSDLRVHSDKETALECFNRECHKWFSLNTKFKADKLPAAYGYPHRNYYGLSARAFKQMFHISVAEALSIAEGVSDKEGRNK